MTEIFTQHHKAHGFPLPPVLPLVLHQGPDAKGIYHTLSTNPELEKSTMSVAEKLKAEGRLEGISQAISKGLWLWVGRISTADTKRDSRTGDLFEVLYFPALNRWPTFRP